MTTEKTPVMLTSEQISFLQSLVLEKQLELASKQFEGDGEQKFSQLSQPMSHATDLLLALNEASEAGTPQPRLNANTEIETSVSP